MEALKIMGLLMLVEAIVVAAVVLAGLFTKWTDIYNEDKKDERIDNI